MQSKKHLRLIQKKLQPEGVDDSLIENKLMEQEKKTAHQIWKKSKEENWSKEKFKEELIKNNVIVKKADEYQDLFDFFNQEHDLILTIEQMDEIIKEVESHRSKKQ